MTHETRRQEASREAREDEAEQALQDDLDLEETEGDLNDKERAMTSATKKHDEYQPGDEVTVNVEGQDLDGVVRSVQLSKGLVDVQVYKHGQHEAWFDAVASAGTSFRAACQGKIGLRFRIPVRNPQRKDGPSIHSSALLHASRRRKSTHRAAQRASGAHRLSARASD